MVSDGEIRFTGMGFAVDGGRILTYVPTWEGGRPTDASIVAIPQQSVDTAAATSKAPTAPVPSLDAVVDAMFHLQQGQRHLTPPFSSPYIDKPIRTFFAKGWLATASLDRKTLMSDAALMNYALGLSRGQSMGLIERTYREARHLVADLATMAAMAAADATEPAGTGDGADDDATGGSDGDVRPLTDDERQRLSVALSDADANVLWVVGIGWLCCWHDHMATKKDFTSGILKSWFSQVESELKVVTPMSWERFASDEAVSLVRDIGRQCLQSCWVISDEDGEVSDVLASEDAWESMFARERDHRSVVVTVEMLTDEIRAEIRSEEEDEDDPDDIIPESMMSLKRDIESMMPGEMDMDDE